MACKKTVRYLGMLMLVILVMSTSLQAFAATHVHEWGSYESIERVYFVESDKVLFTYKDADGHTYEVHRIIEYCKFYKSCYAVRVDNIEMVAIHMTNMSELIR